MGAKNLWRNIADWSLYRIKTKKVERIFKTKQAMATMRKTSSDTLKLRRLINSLKVRLEKLMKWNITRGTTDPGYWVHNSNHHPWQITFWRWNEIHVWLQKLGLESKTWIIFEAKTKKKKQCLQFKPLSTPWWPPFPPCTPPCRPIRPPPSQWQSSPTQ